MATLQGQILEILKRWGLSGPPSNCLFVSVSILYPLYDPFLNPLSSPFPHFP